MVTMKFFLDQSWRTRNPLVITSPGTVPTKTSRSVSSMRSNVGLGRPYPMGPT